MNIKKIVAVLDSHSATIQSAGSFSERLNVVYDVLDKNFPVTSAAAALYGPITSFTDYISRAEIDQLLQVIKKSSDAGHKYVTTDAELNDVLKTIYEIVSD